MGAEFIFCSLCFGLDFQTKRQNQGLRDCIPLGVPSKNWTLRNSQIHTNWAGLSICTKQIVKNGNVSLNFKLCEKCKWVWKFISGKCSCEHLWRQLEVMGFKTSYTDDIRFCYYLPSLLSIGTPWWKNVKSSKLSTHQRQIAGLTFAACVMNVCCVCASDLLVQPPMLPQYS